MAAKKKGKKKKKSFVLSDEELDKVSGGTGITTTVRPIAVKTLVVSKSIGAGGISAEPFQSDPQTPMRINRATIPGVGGGEM